MGWFLTKQSGRSKRGSRSKAAAACPSRRERIIVTLQVLGLVAVVVGVVVGWPHARAHLIEHVRVHHAQSVQPDQIVLVEAPMAQLDPVVVEELQWLVAAAATGDPFDSQGIQLALRQIEQHPWVIDAQRIERWQHTVRVHARYRLPFAVVEAGRDRYHLVDRQGVVLRTGYATEHLSFLRGEHGLPVIVGVREPSPEPGHAWPGHDLQGALSLAALLMHQPFADQIVAYDASEQYLDGQTRYVLQTRKGKVFWGAAPGRERAMEDDPARKTAWLADIAYSSLGSIDSHGRIIYLDKGKYEIRSAVIRP